MKRPCQNLPTKHDRTAKSIVSRRSALCCSGVALLGLLSPSALGQTEDGEVSPKKKRTAKPPKDASEGTEKPKAQTKRMRSAGSDAERRRSWISK